METTAKKTATQVARELLQRAVDEAKRRGMPRLPTVRQLAAQAGVSHPTMLAAVRQMVAEGVMESRRRRGLTLRDASRPRPRLHLSADDLPRPKWRDLAVRIERDIQDGVHEPGTPLPSCKQLAADYGTGYRTLRRALAMLASHGSLRPHKRGFLVREIESLRHHSSVVLITRGDRQGSLTETTPRMHEQILAVERECSQRNLRLQVFTYDFEPGYLYPTEQWREFVGSEEARGSVMGFIVWPVTMGSDALHDLIVRLARIGKPVSVLDEGSEVRLPTVPADECSVRLFAMAATSPIPTRALGRYLLALGHRSVAFVSPFNSALWSRNRLRGLRQAFAAAGYADSVRAFVGEQIADARSREATRQIYAAVDDLTSSVSLAGSATEESLGRALRTLRWRIGSTMQEQAEREALSGLFGQALKEAPEATAWVGANDYVAVEAVDFLRERGRNIPDDLSVVGLDDGLLAHLHKLTSYNFNGPALIRAMVGHILDPGRGRRREQRDTGPVEIEGYVVVRETSGKATSDVR